ncbi:hypothetical protein SHK09_05105 [Polaribacter sp. PL03]|uniref:hypothetical protein n=1 Tax=Polaribacter sp. PL03 TaxID=3088353 RepID=UPI0029D2CD2F|nr:hypothetical protein [Polaribacter sp. PL03]MDX6746162.1 hypothetical protein [Polaribacter sp. PL03]
MVLFLLPIFALSAHAFSGHEHVVCTSKVEKHLHEQNVDCKLHILKTSNSYLVENNFNFQKKPIISTDSSLQYNFLKNHYQLSFSLRGPPLCI